ncbi:hypothetical protein [Priestia aryabhattai]|nr:hypothetical protein [Priestia aryabhattai]
MLITNNKLPEKYNKYFEENGIKILRVPFTHFLMPSQFVWSNAFYKLNALNYVINNLEYDYYLELDTDTYVPRNLNDLWSECEYDNLLLYNTKHKASHPVRKAIMEDYEKIFRKKSNVQQWGGEFICGNKQVLKLFLDKLQEVYNSIATAGFNVDTNSGDEMLISIAAKSMNILDSGAYIERYWTQRFYLSSTNWANDYVLIWHLPAEKKYGMIELYDYYEKKRKFPSITNTRKMLNLPSTKHFSKRKFKIYISKFLKKVNWISQY